MAPIAAALTRIEATAEGAIAQLGERVVRNDEVGGSIPPGSTSLRRLRLLRLGKPIVAKPGSILQTLVCACFGSISVRKRPDERGETELFPDSPRSSEPSPHFPVNL